MKQFLIIGLTLFLLTFSPALADTLAQQVNAPGHVQAEYHSNTGKTTISVDATVFLPAVDAISTYAVAGRDATPQDAMLLALACAPGTDWLTDWQRDIPSSSLDWDGGRDAPAVYVSGNGRSRSEDFMYCWFPLSDGSAAYSPSRARHWEAWVSAFNGWQETAFGLRRTDATIEYGIWDYRQSKPPRFHASMAYMEHAGKSIQGDDGLSGQPLSWNEATAMAEAFIAALSPDFELIWRGVAHGEDTNRKAYAFRFMRKVAGVPVTYAYTGRQGDKPSDQPYSAPPEMEEIACVIDQEQIVSAVWRHPWSVGGLLHENIELLPFEQIMKVFGTIAPLTIQHVENENSIMGGSDNRWEISEIRLGYMPVLRKDDSGEWELRPVWDFIGERFLAREHYDFPGYCALTIDAVNGTVIDRGYGY